MREWYRDIVYGLTLLIGSVNTYIAMRGPRAADPPVVQSVASHPIGGLIVVGVLFLLAGVLNVAPLINRLLLTRFVNDKPEGSNEPDTVKHSEADAATLKEMADSDTKNMVSRVTAVRWMPRRVFDHNNNYVEFEITFVNASVFELTSPQLLGIAEFDRQPLPHPPRIVEPFPLVRGARTWMKIHQPLSREMATDLQQRVNRDGMIANLDFSKVRIIFDAELPGRQSWKWSWAGREASVKEITTF